MIRAETDRLKTTNSAKAEAHRRTDRSDGRTSRTALSTFVFFFPLFLFFSHQFEIYDNDIRGIGAGLCLLAGRKSPCFRLWRARQPRIGHATTDPGGVRNRETGGKSGSVEKRGDQRRVRRGVPIRGVKPSHLPVGVEGSTSYRMMNGIEDGLMSKWSLCQTGCMKNKNLIVMVTSIRL